ncbi:MAG: DUF1080 domain-containing protein, partial [Verrucomicrobia bacterium]
MVAAGWLAGACGGPAEAVLFDGTSLAGWRVIDFPEHGPVRLTGEGWLEIGMGPGLSGVVFTGEVPNLDFEISLEARRVEGGDFFCGLTVPVGESHCTLVVGGWGGSLVGISSIDGLDASENETQRMMRFERGRWYRIRMRVTAGRLMAWIDERLVVAADIEGRRVSLRPGLISMGV